MGRPRLLVHDVATALALAAMLAAPLRVASADDGPSAEAPAPAPTTAEPPAAAAEETPPPKSTEQTPEERARALGWDDETTEQPAAPTEPKAKDAEEDEDEDDEDEEPDVDDVIKADPVLAKDYKKARAMAIGGGATAAVGLILIPSGAYFVAVEAISRDSMGAVSNQGRLIGGWVTMGIGLAALTAGVVVMALGLTKRKRVITEAEARLPPTASVTPWFGNRSGGVGLSVRF